MALACSTDSPILTRPVRTGGVTARAGRMPERAGG
jgi:hypothetical protein